METFEDFVRITGNGFVYGLLRVSASKLANNYVT